MSQRETENRFHTAGRAVRGMSLPVFPPVPYGWLQCLHLTKNSYTIIRLSAACSLYVLPLSKLPVSLQETRFKCNVTTPRAPVRYARAWIEPITPAGYDLTMQWTVVALLIWNH